MTTASALAMIDYMAQGAFRTPKRKGRRPMTISTSSCDPVERFEHVPFSCIIADESFNARKTYRDIDKLAETIKSQGQIEPFQLAEGPWVKACHFQLVQGFRRHRARELLARAATPRAASLRVPAIIRFYQTRDEAMITALACDSSSDPLRCYDLADRCDYLNSKFKMPLKALGEMIGKSLTEVGMLLGCYRELIPEVKTAWGKAPDPDKEIPLTRLNRWRKESPIIQKRLLEAYQDGDRPLVDDDGEPVKNRTGKRVDNKRPSVNVLRSTLERLSKKRGASKEIDGMCKALRFALGDIARLF